SPVKPGWREDLDRQARDIMHATDLAIGNAAKQFRAPAFYTGPEPFEQEGGGQGPAPGTGGAHKPPHVPLPGLDPPAQTFSARPEMWSRLGAPILDGDALRPRSPPADVPSFEGESVSPLVTTPAGLALAPGGVIGAATTAVRRESTGPTDGAPATRSTGKSAGSTTGTTLGSSTAPLMAPPVGGRAGANAGARKV